MTKVRLGNLCLAAAVAGVILCAVLMRAFYMPYSGFWRTVLYNILIFLGGIGLVAYPTRESPPPLLESRRLMFWLDIRLIRYDFARRRRSLRRLWYAYIPSLADRRCTLYALLFGSRDSPPRCTSTGT